MSYFLERVGKPLWEYAGDLLVAAFPEFKPANVREAIKKRFKRFTPSSDLSPTVPPLHKIVGSDTRRAAAMLLADNARQDVLAMEIAEINRKIKEGLPGRKANKTKIQASKPHRPVCDSARCAQIKMNYKENLGVRVSRFAGRILNEELGGIYFVCEDCLKVCHDLCDKLVTMNGANRCRKCKPR